VKSLWEAHREYTRNRDGWQENCTAEQSPEHRGDQEAARIVPPHGHGRRLGSPERTAPWTMPGSSASTREGSRPRAHVDAGRQRLPHERARNVRSVDGESSAPQDERAGQRRCRVPLLQYDADSLEHWKRPDEIYEDHR
jgi:hypothetical protein